MKTTEELVSFSILVGISMISMIWYASIIHVPIKEPAHVSRQFWV